MSGSKSAPWGFFLLVYIFALPFWLIGLVAGADLLPGLPISALMAVCPVAAATILLYRRAGLDSAAKLLRRSFDFQRGQRKAWYLVALLLAPALSIASYVVSRFLGSRIPTPEWSVATTAALFVFFFIGALAEELGWSGYATDPAQDRWGALGAGVIIGLVWAIWHFVPLLQAHRSMAWIGWWTLGTVATRVLIVWIYENTGKSVFATALYHTMGNMAWQLFPVHGSYFDPRISGIVTAFAALAIWGSRTLTRGETARNYFH